MVNQPKLGHIYSETHALENGELSPREPEAREQAQRWLDTDLPDGAFRRESLHWPLVFPEVFENGGFDAIIGNPPFLGGKKISGPLGVAYREYLVDVIAGEIKGHADLVAYFALRAHDVLNDGGQTGIIATNTLAQGDTREVGLDQIVDVGNMIRQSIKSQPWPSKSAVLEYCAVWTIRASLDERSTRIADGVAVASITSSLDPGSRATGQPERLAKSSGIVFNGQYIMGIGFTTPVEFARELIGKDSKNSEVLFPYLSGQDVNSRADSSASRWVINFHDWPEGRASTYPDCFNHERYSKTIFRIRWTIPFAGLTKLGVSHRATALPRGINSFYQDRVQPPRKDRCVTSVLQA